MGERLIAKAASGVRLGGWHEFRRMVLDPEAAEIDGPAKGSYR